MASDLSIYWAIIAVLCIGIIILIAVIIKNSTKNQRNDESLNRFYMLMERSLAQQKQDNEQQQRRAYETERQLFERLQQSHQDTTERLHAMSTKLSMEQAETRVEQVNAMRDLTEQNARNLSELRQSVSDRLHSAVEEQMQTSFKRVLEQFSQVQKMIGEVSSVTAQIGDLRKLFSNVKTRGGWGEAQLRSILDDILPPGTYETNVRLRENTQESVEFAVYMPMQGSVRPLLSIDSKFPTEAYERLLNAIEQVDNIAEQAARKALETIMRQEARKIASKYIQPPKTVDYAILYLPTDGLYAEIARIPGLIDNVGREHRVLVMCPALMPPLLRTIHLGYVSLALNEKTEVISNLLGKTRQEMIKIDDVFEKLSRHANMMVETITDLRKRSQKLKQRLQDVGNMSCDDKLDNNEHFQ